MIEITPQELYDAIKAYDPNGCGFARVWRAAIETVDKGVGAGKDGIYSHDTEACILQKAWKADWVEKWDWSRHGVESGNPYPRIVQWEDEWEDHQQMAAAVLALLEQV